MATMRITEYSEVATDDKGRPVPLPVEPPLRTQVVTFTTATQSAALRSDTRFVRMESSVDMFVLFGANPTATATNCGRIPANTVEWRCVDGNVSKASVYDGSS